MGGSPVVADGIGHWTVGEADFVSLLCARRPTAGRPNAYGSSTGWSGARSATGSPSHDVAGVAQYRAIASSRGA